MSKQKTNYLDYLKTKDKKWNIILIAVLLIAIGILGRLLVIAGIVLLIVILIKQYLDKEGKKKNGK